VRPPTLAVFCNSEKLFSAPYRKYLDRVVRANVGFEGTPIKWVWKEKGSVKK